MPNFPLRPLVAALLLVAAGAAQAADDDASMWSFRGFGTLAAVHSSEREADFVGSNQQPNGAGRTKATSFGPDSKIASQVTAKFTPDLSAVVQVVSQHQYDNTWKPQIEWVNLQYQLTPALRVRIGRIAAPTFMESETRLVGYANAAVRAPQEIYNLNTITSNDGMDATYASQFGDSVNSLSGFYGTSKVKFPGVTGNAKSNWGINDTLESGAATLRISYQSMTADVDVPAGQQLFAGFDAFGAAASAIPVPSIQAAGARALAIPQKYSFQNFRQQTLSISAAYDSGTWFATGEYVHMIGSRARANANAAAVTAGYRVGTWTPYATLAELKTAPLADGIPTSGLPPQLAAGAAALNAGLKALLTANSGTEQKSASLGLRWDFMKNTDAKLQYDHVVLGDGSHGPLVNASASFQPGGKFNLVTIAVDFVF